MFGAGRVGERRASMRTIEVRLTLGEAELLEAAEDLERLLDGENASPLLRHLLLAVDDAFTGAFARARTARLNAPSSRPRRTPLQAQARQTVRRARATFPRDQRPS